jgi:thiamine pyrophosphokinase
MRIIIVCGSPVKSFNRYKYQSDDYLIGVDAGCEEIIQCNYPLDVAIGDFDHSKDLSLIKMKTKKFISYDPNKDEIDLELAIKYILKNIKKASLIPVYIYDALGARTDFELMTFKILIKYQQLDLNLVNSNEIISYKTKSVLLNMPHKTFSIIALEKAIISIDNALYNLEKTTIDIDTLYTSSNKTLDEVAVISIYQGGIILILEY